MASPPFLHLGGKLVARIANCKLINRASAQLLTTGELLALNKIDESQQLMRVLAGLDPAVRTVNIGTALLKWAIKLAITTLPVTKAIKTLLEIQLGLSAKCGNEILAHYMRASYLPSSAQTG